MPDFVFAHSAVIRTLTFKMHYVSCHGSFSKWLLSDGGAGLKPAIALIRAGTETFHYRGKDKRIINFVVLDRAAWDENPGPLVYGVFDSDGRVRYIGKHEGKNSLRCRWMRHSRIHHQESARNHYVGHLDAAAHELDGRLTVACATAVDLQTALMNEGQYLSGMRPIQVATALEALWIDRVFGALWNGRHEPLVAGVTDGFVDAVVE